MKKDIKKYIPWIILLIVITSLSVWYILSRRVTQEQLDTYTNIIEEADTHIEARQYSTSLEKLYQAVDTIPSKVDAYERILHILISKNRYDDALGILEKASNVLSSQDKSTLYKILGDAQYNRTNYKEAFNLYDSGLILGVKNMDLELVYGKSMLQLGNISDAKKQFQKTGYEENTLSEATLLLAYIEATKDPSKAKNILKDVKPISKMEIYFDELTEVLESLDSDQKYNASKLSRIYINNGYPYLAISVLEPLKEDISEYLEGMYFLGRAYFENGEYSKSLDTLDAALSLGGMETDILWIKARIYMKQKDFDSAFKAYESAIGYGGETLSEELVKEYIDILLDNAQILKSIEIIKNVLVGRGESVELNLLAVRIYSQNKEKVKVEYYLSKLEDLELDKTQEKEYLQWKIERAMEEDKDIDEYMERLLELDKYSSSYYLYLGKQYLDKQDTQQAKQSFEKALEYDLDYTVTEEVSKLLSSLR